MPAQLFAAAAANAGGQIFSGAGSALGSALQYGLQKKVDKKAFERQLILLAYQQQWAERMANTAHQREVKDLRAAGLNPILSAGGAGAMTPAVGASTVSTGSKVDRPVFPELDLVGAMNTASATDLNRENAKKVAEEKKLTTELLNTERLKQSQIKAQTAKTVADTAGVLSDNKGKATKGKGADIVGGLLDGFSDLFGSARQRKDVVSGAKEWLKDPVTYVAPGYKILKEGTFGPGSGNDVLKGKSGKFYPFNGSVGKFGSKGGTWFRKLFKK